MLARFKIIIQNLLPKQLITQAMGWLANQQLGKITTWLIKLFVRCYKIDLQEAAETSVGEYKTFNDFFIRKLNNDARPVFGDENILVFPADGVVSQFGEINENRLIQAKGFDYTLDSLLVCNTAMIKQFTNGLFITTYLSPRDYHRVHMPCDATLREIIYVPGSLFSVNKLTAENIPNLFARNERVICLFDTAFGPMIQILVGATIVGSIDVKWLGTVVPPREGILKRWVYPIEGQGCVKLKKGEEMGYFKLGSTVINLFSSNSITFNSQIQNDFITRVGTYLGDRL